MKRSVTNEISTSNEIEEWVTYIHPKYRPITQLASEQRPMWRQALEPRPATTAEIARERRRRKERKTAADALKAWKERQDYKDADAIRSLLEFMAYDNHPLDELTPHEWAELRRKLGA